MAVLDSEQSRRIAVLHRTTDRFTIEVAEVAANWKACSVPFCTEVKSDASAASMISMRGIEATTSVAPAAVLQLVVLPISVPQNRECNINRRFSIGKSECGSTR